MGDNPDHLKLTMWALAAISVGLALYGLYILVRAFLV